LKAKILIVGGGAMGTCTALYAAKHSDPMREPVVLVERDTLAAGASGRTSAIVHQGFADRVMASMARDTVKVYSGMRASTGRSLGYRRTGALILAGDSPERIAELDANIDVQSSLAINVTRVEAEEMRQLFPGIEISDKAVGAWQPEGGFIDPARTISVFAALAREKGATIREGSGAHKLLLEGDKVVGVQTEKETYHCENVVLATGAWTHTFLKDYGVDLPMRALKTRESFLSMPPVEGPEEDELDMEGSHGDMETRFMINPLDSAPVAHPVLIDLERDFQTRCDPLRSRTRVEQLGLADAEEISSPDGWKPDGSENSDAFCGWAREAIAGRLPIYRDQEDLGTHTAWLTVSPDGVPVVGPVNSIKGLYVMAGFSGRDFHLAPSIGEGLAQMILGNPVSAFDPAALSPDRF